MARTSCPEPWPQGPIRETCQLGPGDRVLPSSFS
eukprot:CAMPEP_0179214120 /NCGR_PEP_ID=MMETSP0797-20121207/2112_1 /TAXON_ID=47934 /ORGANISM="Dinophysis acuminata, Strain DAEP01" /LENGTH=33 /DNA_ID= /DNA_START= /DNA_END= /DNA_ORIENTATION=